MNSFENQIYEAAMKEYCFSREKVNHDTFESELRYAVNNQPPKKDTIDDEVTKLIKNLPTSFDSSIFVAQDAKDPRRFSALLFGSNDTPYDSCGLILHIYLPNRYPEVPPKVKFITNSNGYLKISPNIMGNGTIYLSLLGTWSSKSAYDSWDPKISSLYQVLMSIQNNIFIQEPYFNDIGKQSEIGTSIGNTHSQNYNQRARLICVAEGICGLIKNPPEEFETLIKAHFSIKKEYVTQKLEEWKVLVDTTLGYDYTKYQGKTFEEWADEAIALLTKVEEEIKDFV